MRGFYLPFENSIKRKFIEKSDGFVTPSSVANKHYNDKNLNKLFIGIKIIWAPVSYVSCFCLLLLFFSLF